MYYVLPPAGLTLTQSVAIMEYLHDLQPEAGLLPSSPDQRAVVRMITEMITSGIQPLQVRGEEGREGAETEVL